MKIEEFDAAEPLWDPRQTADYINTTPKHLQDLRISGKGPPYVRIGYRTIRYVPALVREYVRRRMFTRTSAETR